MEPVQFHPRIDWNKVDWGKVKAFIDNALEDVALAITLVPNDGSIEARVSRRYKKPTQLTLVISFKATDKRRALAIQNLRCVSISEKDLVRASDFLASALKGIDLRCKRVYDPGGEKDYGVIEYVLKPRYEDFQVT